MVSGSVVYEYKVTDSEIRVVLHKRFQPESTVLDQTDQDHIVGLQLEVFWSAQMPETEIRPYFEECMLNAAPSFAKKSSDTAIHDPL